jgi:hypothetical protein
MPAKKTSWKQFQDYVCNNQKIFFDLMKNPGDPNAVLKKHKMPPMSKQSLSKWNNTWNGVIDRVIEPGMVALGAWGGVWPKEWSRIDFMKNQVGQKELL